jgi:hypothetical protein
MHSEMLIFSGINEEKEKTVPVISKIHMFQRSIPQNQGENPHDSCRN